MLSKGHDNLFHLRQCIVEELGRKHDGNLDSDRGSVLTFPPLIEDVLLDFYNKLPAEAMTRCTIYRTIEELQQIPAFDRVIEYVRGETEDFLLCMTPHATTHVVNGLVRQEMTRVCRCLVEYLAALTMPGS